MRLNVADADALPWTVLCVDDEPNILAALQRAFRQTGYRVLLAQGGTEAIEMLATQPVHLVISDMRMPRMDGAQLLQTVRERWPDAARILLTGHADVASTIAAINRGEIFRYIAKPWNEEELLQSAREGLERQALIRAKARLEREVAGHNEELTRLNSALEGQVAARTADLSTANARLDRNYLDSITALSNLIEMRGSSIAGHSRRVADLARRMAASMGLQPAQVQDVFVAGLLHDIGEVGLPDSVLGCPVARMSAAEKGQYARHPVLGEQALLALQDMQRVASIVRAHHERHDGLGFPDGLRGGAVPIGARILAVADTYDDLQSTHLARAALSVEEARLFIGRGRDTQFDPAVVDACLKVTAVAPSTPAFRQVPVDKLQAGMVLAHDLSSRDGVVLLATGHALDADLIERIKAYAVRHELVMHLAIQQAADKAEPAAFLPFRTLA